MLSKEGVRSAATVAALLLTILGLAWSGGARLAKLDASANGQLQFKTEQLATNYRQELRNNAVAEQLTRVETMTEMVVQRMGMSLPPKRSRSR